MPRLTDLLLIGIACLCLYGLYDPDTAAALLVDGVAQAQRLLR